MNNCYGCRYFKEYNDGKFTFPICIRHYDLGSASEAVKNSDTCKYKTEFCMDEVRDALLKVTHTFKGCAEGLRSFAEGLRSFAEGLEESLEKEATENEI